MASQECAYETVVRAIALMTAWLEDACSTRLVEDVLLSYVADDVPNEDLIVGLLNLAGALVVRLDEAGLEPRSVLQDIATCYRP